MPYYQRRPRSFSERHWRLEMAVTAIVLVVVIAALVYFLVFHHDLPLRVTGGNG